MISFKQFLTESRSAPLYHGTDLYNLEPILVNKQGIAPRTSHESNELLITRRSPHKMIKGISTSRNFKFAAQYRGFNDSVILELNQNLLSQNYKLVPIQFWQHLNDRPARPQEKSFVIPKRNEYEEFIVTDKPVPVKYITRLYIPLVYKDMDVIKEIAKQYGSSFVRTF